MFTSVVALATAFTVVPSCALFFEAAPAAAPAPKKYPVSKVVELLKEMQADIEKDAEADEAMYEKLACWCETNNKGKTEAIASGEAAQTNLGETIEKNAALSASLKVEIAALKKELAADQKALATAIALREKQKEEFLAEEREMIESIRQLKAAITVLAKQQGTAFLSNQAIMTALSTAKAEMEKHALLLEDSITASQKKIILAFNQEAAPTFNQPYAPQSGQIFGILNQMLETFTEDLSTSQKTEMADQATFKDLKEAKEKEIAVGEAAITEKEQQLAHADETLAQAKEDLEDVSNSLSADKKFLMELKVKCKMTDKEWEERQKLRQKELEACSKAIEILSSDEAREQFDRTFNGNSSAAASFLQVDGEKNAKREKAAKALSRITRQTPKLAALATAVRLDPFPKVKKAIDDMVSALLKEKEEEIKEKDYCISKMDENTLTTEDKAHHKKRLQAKIAGLEQTIKELTASLDTVDKEIADLEAGREKAKLDRAAERAEFEAEISEQQKTQAMLAEALHVLKEVYNDGSVLLQHGNAAPAPAAMGGYEAYKATAAPKDFDAYEHNAGSTPIIMMLENIIADTKELEAAAHHDEGVARDEYTKFVQTTNEGLEAKEDQKTDLTAQKAQAEQDKTNAGTELDGTMTELEALAEGKADLHKSCDFALANFEVKQKARDEEIDALRQAKAYLSGMKPASS
jgi:hypothetical protein